MKIKPKDLTALSDARSEYADALRSFARELENAVRFSVALRGSTSSHGRQHWSSVIFTKLVLSGMSLRKLVPPGVPVRKDELWDLASVACLARAFLENVLILQWLCGNDEGEDLWQFRIVAMQIVDNRARYRMIDEPQGGDEPLDFQQSQKSLEDHIRRTEYFNSLSAIKQKEILKGNKLPFIHDEVIDTLGFEQKSFRSLYRYLSSFVHTGTISFWRMKDTGRGDGSSNLYDTQAINAIFIVLTEMLTAALRIMREIHGKSA